MLHLTISTTINNVPDKLNSIRLIQLRFNNKVDFSIVLLICKFKKNRFGYNKK